jgi:hypothetical protein
MPACSGDECCGPVPTWNTGNVHQNAASSVIWQHEQSCIATGIPVQHSLRPPQAVLSTESTPNHRLASSQTWPDEGRPESSGHPINPMQDSFQLESPFTLTPEVTSSASMTRQVEMPVPSSLVAHHSRYPGSCLQDPYPQTVSPSIGYGMNWPMPDHNVPNRLRIESWDNDELPMNCSSSAFCQYPEPHNGTISVNPTIFSHRAHTQGFQDWGRRRSTELIHEPYPPEPVSGFPLESMGCERRSLGHNTVPRQVLSETLPRKLYYTDTISLKEYTLVHFRWSRVSVFLPRVSPVYTLVWSWIPVQLLATPCAVALWSTRGRVSSG